VVLDRMTAISIQVVMSTGEEALIKSTQAVPTIQIDI